MHFLLSLLYFSIFIFLIFRLTFFKKSGLSPKTISGLFILKILAGLILFLIYTQHYKYRQSSDAFKYFDDASVLFSSLRESPVHYFKMLTGIDQNDPALLKYYSKMNSWFLEDSVLYNDNRTVIRLNAIVLLFSFGYYHVHTLFFCFLSLIGLVGIFKTFQSWFQGKKALLLVCVFMFPSMLFWSSGVLKEAVLMFGLGIFIYYFFKIIHEGFSSGRLICLLLAVFLLLHIKFYVLIALIPVCIAYAWVNLTGEKKILLKYSLTFLCFFILSLIPRMLGKSTDPYRIIAEKQEAFIRLAKGGAFYINTINKDTVHVNAGSPKNTVTKDSVHFFFAPPTVYHHWTAGRDLDTITVSKTDSVPYTFMFDFGTTGSRIEIGKLTNDPLSFIKNIPAALANTLFRPFPWEADSMLILIAVFENLLLLALVIFFSARSKKLSATEFNLFLFCTGFSIFLSIIIGLVTPVLGAIVRYKIPLLPFFLAGFLLLFKGEKKLEKIDRVIEQP